MFYLKGNDREYLKGDSLRNRVLRAPKTDPSLSWGKRKSQTHRNEDSRLISEAAAHLNKFSNDGNFMKEMLSKQKSVSVSPVETRGDHRSDLEQKALPLETNKDGEGTLPSMDSLSVNKLAAEALKLRMKGKPEEAQKLMVRE